MNPRLWSSAFFALAALVAGPSAAQSITGISPTSAPTAGGTTLTITGSGFDTSPWFTVGGRLCPVDSPDPDPTRKLCPLPEGEGAGLDVQLSTRGVPRWTRSRRPFPMPPRR